MAAGAIPPEDGFRHAFENGADFCLAGMFDFEIQKDVKIAREAATAFRVKENLESFVLAQGLTGKRALDVGTGTGVLGLLLARAGARVTATDISPDAVACARENAQRLAVADKMEVVEADLFPEGRFDLVVCNPPWLPHEAVTALDRAVYDPGGRFLARFLEGLAAHLAPGGEGWLILSDLAERLGLRGEGELERQLEAAGLGVAGGIEAAPRHPRSRDQADPLHEARSKEVTALRRLVVRGK